MAAFLTPLLRHFTPVLQVQILSAHDFTEGGKVRPIVKDSAHGHLEGRDHITAKHAVMLANDGCTALPYAMGGVVGKAEARL